MFPKKKLPRRYTELLRRITTEDTEDTEDTEVHGGTRRYTEF